jgi:hypothetical protein
LEVAVWYLKRAKRRIEEQQAEEKNRPWVLIFPDVDYPLWDHSARDRNKNDYIRQFGPFQLIIARLDLFYHKNVDNTNEYNALQNQIQQCHKAIRADLGLPDGFNYHKPKLVDYTLQQFCEDLQSKPENRVEVPPVYSINPLLRDLHYWGKLEDLYESDNSEARGGRVWQDGLAPKPDPDFITLSNGQKVWNIQLDTTYLTI